MTSREAAQRAQLSMVCGAGTAGRWGYLDPQTGLVTPPRPDPVFQERLKALNPHVR